ncbi:hypothetical protein BLOT_003146 [Blomia tropicalis]|nr:hypothetical protein BLOT_003146 [Blomia tropicalis]
MERNKKTANILECASTLVVELLSPKWGNIIVKYENCPICGNKVKEHGEVERLGTINLVRQPATNKMIQRELEDKYNNTMVSESSNQCTFVQEHKQKKKTINT